MALAQVSPPKTKNPKVSALANVASIFDIAGSIGSVYDKFKPNKGGVDQATKDLANRSLAEHAGDVQAQSEKIRAGQAEVADMYQNMLKQYANVRLTAKSPGLQNPMWSQNMAPITKWKD